MSKSILDTIIECDQFQFIKSLQCRFFIQGKGWALENEYNLEKNSWDLVLGFFGLSDSANGEALKILNGKIFQAKKIGNKLDVVKFSSLSQKWSGISNIAEKKIEKFEGLNILGGDINWPTLLTISTRVGVATPLALLTDKSELNYLWNSIRPSEVLQRSELDHYRGGLVLAHAPSELLMKQIVEFIDAGNSVFWCIPSKSLRGQIQKAHQWIHSNSEYSLQYLSDILKLSIYLKDLSSEIQGQDLIGTAGVVFGNEARRSMLNQQWTDFDELEKIPGAWSLDQSLVHSLMRRQMSIKHALSLSVNPQRLDEQLKEMGI